MTDAADAGPVLGLDCFAAATHAPGVGRYGRELVRAWLRCDEQLAGLALYEVGASGRRLPAWDEAVGGEGRARRPRRHLRLAVPRRAADLVCRAVGADRVLGGCDAFLRARPDSPALARAPSLWALAQWPDEDDAGAEARFRACLAANDHLLVFARAAAERLVERYGVDPERVHATPVGCEHWRRAAEPLDAPREPRTLLVLGAVEPRRRPEVVLAAFERAVERGRLDRLLIVGRRGPASADFERRLGFSSARSRVEWIDAPREADLPEIVRGAAVLVHVGTGEATPVTPLEGLAFGLPVVVDPLPELCETLGDVATYCEPAHGRRRGEALADAVERALDADDGAARAVRRERAAAYTWDACARATDAVLRRVAAAGVSA